MAAKILALIGMLGVLGGIGVPNAHSQAPDSTIGAQVERAVHGPDGAGRDGPMATLDRALISLYYEHQAYLEGTQSGAFSPSDGQLSVRDAHVTVDAIAKKKPEALLDSLRALGLQNGAQAERLVSGRLPIEALRDAAELSLLQSMRGSRMETNMRSGKENLPMPSDPTKKETGDSVKEEASTPTADSQRTPEVQQNDDHSPDADSLRPSDSNRDSVSSRGDEPLSSTEPKSTTYSDSDSTPIREEDVEGAALDDGIKSVTMYAIGAGILLLGIGFLVVLRLR
jgi:hypothetical protein